MTPLARQEIALETKLMLARGRIEKKRGAHAAKQNAIARGTRYNVGDVVPVKAYNLSSAHDNLIAKFLVLYEGPYVIAEKQGPSTFLLTNPNTDDKRGVFHASNFRPYLQNVDEKPEEAFEEKAPERDMPHSAPHHECRNGAQAESEGDGGGAEGPVPRMLFQKGLMARLREADSHNQRQDQTGAWHSQHFAPPAPSNSPVDVSPIKRRARVMEFVSRNPGTQLRQQEPSPSSDNEDILVIDEEVVL